VLGFLLLLFLVCHDARSGGGSFANARVKCGEGGGRRDDAKNFSTRPAHSSHQADERHHWQRNWGAVHARRLLESHGFIARTRRTTPRVVGRRRGGRAPRSRTAFDATDGVRGARGTLTESPTIPGSPPAICRRR
jgi:hypothetical protein